MKLDQGVLKNTEYFNDEYQNSGVVLSQLINLLQSIELDSQEAKLNETSISDNNGGRIML